MTTRAAPTPCSSAHAHAHAHAHHVHHIIHLAEYAPTGHHVVHLAKSSPEHILVSSERRDPTIIMLPLPTPTLHLFLSGRSSYFVLALSLSSLCEFPDYNYLFFCAVLFVVFVRRLRSSSFVVVRLRPSSFVVVFVRRLRDQ